VVLEKEKVVSVPDRTLDRTTAPHPVIHCREDAGSALLRPDVAECDLCVKSVVADVSKKEGGRSDAPTHQVIRPNMSGHCSRAKNTFWTRSDAGGPLSPVIHSVCLVIDVCGRALAVNS
jgi:hypothetical protein